MLEDTYRHKGMRKQLVKKLKEKSISDPAVLHAIETVPRHVFFEKAFLEQAYQDIAFPIGEGQTISQPYTVAYQTQLLELKKGMKVLEIGTGSGYQCCILLELGAKVFTIEKEKNLYVKCSQLLPKLGYFAKFFLGDGTLGLPQFAPFDRIIVTAGGPQIPSSLVDQLANDGILIIPVGNEKEQRMIKVSRAVNGSIQQKDMGNFRFVPLIGKQGWQP